MVYSDDSRGGRVILYSVSRFSLVRAYMCFSGF